MSELTYKKAGVDIDAGERFVELISPIAKKTFRKEVLTDIGSFSGLFRLDISRYKEPILVSGTDGVGTKLKIAFMANKHDSVGIDLVAMCVNDILTCGAEPLFFLDYLATARLIPERAVEIVKGIAEGCTEAGCSLIGGETAEMPGFYQEGEYDIAGFAVGVVEKDKILDGRAISPNDIIIGLASNGLHSNGYSLVRKIFFEHKKISIDSFIPELGTTLGEELLKPTKIYVRAYRAVSETSEIKAMAHITGGGIPGNLPRVLPKTIGARIKKGSWQEPQIFELLRKKGNVPEQDMKRTFNLGIGYIMIVSPDSVDDALSALKSAGYDAHIIGETFSGNREVIYV
jgi:phosphoribosylformylglycinamidine cyclo-ligase